MTTLINKTEEFNSEVESEILNKPEHLKIFNEIDELMKKVSIDYNYEAGMSAINAGKCWVYQSKN
jgi:hypothetical protein